MEKFRLQEALNRATAVLNNLKFCVEAEADELDVLSSLDVLEDYLKQIQTAVDALELERKEG